MFLDEERSCPHLPRSHLIVAAQARKNHPLCAWGAQKESRRRLRRRAPLPQCRLHWNAVETTSAGKGAKTRTSLPARELLGYLACSSSSCDGESSHAYDVSSGRSFCGPFRTSSFPLNPPAFPMHRLARDAAVQACDEQPLQVRHKPRMIQGYVDGKQDACSPKTGILASEHRSTRGQADELLPRKAPITLHTRSSTP